MKVWDDAGTEGRAGSIWVMNSLHLMAAGAGHDPPQGPFWDMKVIILQYSLHFDRKRTPPLLFCSQMCPLLCARQYGRVTDR